MNYNTQAIEALEAFGAFVFVSHTPASVCGLTIPMFNIVAHPVPFEAGEAEALEAVLKCAKDYYKRVCETVDSLPGVVVLGLPDEALSAYGPVVSIRLGIYAENADYFSYVGKEGGEIVMVKKMGYPLCSRCGINRATEPHPCPFAHEINGDDTPCTCCEHCTDLCADEI